MLQSVKRAAAIDRNHHELHEHIVDLTLAGNATFCESYLP